MSYLQLPEEKIPSNLTKEDVMLCARTFERYDSNGDGTIDVFEVLGSHPRSLNYEPV